MCSFKVESNIAYSVFMHCCFTTTPLIIITVCSVKVSRTVSRSNRVSSLKNNPELHRVNVEEAKVTKRLVAVVVGFACCWLPIFIVDNIDMAHGEPTLPRPAYLTYGFLVYLSSTINPFMYCAMCYRAQIRGSDESIRFVSGRFLASNAELTTKTTTLN